jgi:NADH dehydrogenase [ubiquinone] 1 alpha subcomplex assembly factor 5
MLTIDTDEMVVGYPNMLELMFDLKGMAENNAAINRPLTINRDVLLAASTIYEEMFPRENPTTGEKGIQATYQVIFLIGWKKSPTQPKPLERGSANASFKDLGEIITKKPPKKKE